MFLLRSAFWLVIGFLIVAPHGTDFGATALKVRDGAMAASVAASTQIAVMGATAVVEHGALVSHLIPQDVRSPMRRASTLPDVVIPHPRPVALG